jgi:hypothetical protein
MFYKHFCSITLLACVLLIDSFEVGIGFTKDHSNAALQISRGNMMEFIVPGSVSHIAQETANDCWAAAAAMLLSWWARHPVSEDDVIEYADKHLDPDSFASMSFAEMKENGLSDYDKPALFKALALSAEYPANYTIKGWLSLLQKYGPLWVTALSNLNQGSPHAQVVIGMSYSKDFVQASVTFIDTKDGNEKTEDFLTFFKRYETVAINDISVDQTAELRFQVIHLPSL